MDPKAILGLIGATVQTVASVRQLAEQAAAVASSNDADAIKGALVDLQGRNDALHDRLSDKLDVAAKS